MKKILKVFILVLLVFSVTACFNKKNTTDALKFKDEYESMNGVVNEDNGKKIRTVSISKKNPIVYKSADDIVDAMKNKETFLVYFGFSTCPWCRSVIESFMGFLSDTNFSNVYYVDVKEIRDTMKLDSGGKAVVEVKGSSGYYKLLKSLDDVLSDYKLYDEHNNVVLAGEKRIYAPNVVYVKNGKAVGITSGISDKQTDAYMKLTDSMKKDSYNMFQSLLNK